MAALPAEDRRRVHAHLMRLGAMPGGVLKPAGRAAVDAADQWREDNTTSFNTALPLPYRTSATLQEKALLLAYVVMRNAGVLKTQEDP